jgi:hypothetical protein
MKRDTSYSWANDLQWLTPSRLITLISVSQSIKQSNRNDCLRRYSTSRATLAEIASSSRPLICAHPVRPGNSRCTPFCVLSIIRSSWLYNAGRGPTKAMSPLIMLQSCGSSSRLFCLKKRPIGERKRCGVANRCVATAGVPTFILRNFGILKILLYWPTRSDQYKTGPFDEHFTSKARSNNGNKIIAPTGTHSKRSKNLLSFIL